MAVPQRWAAAGGEDAEGGPFSATTAVAEGNRKAADVFGVGGLMRRRLSGNY